MEDIERSNLARTIKKYRKDRKLTSNASAILESCSSLGFLLSVSYFFNVDKFIPLFSLNCSIVSFRSFRHRGKICKRYYISC